MNRALVFRSPRFSWALLLALVVGISSCNDDDDDNDPQDTQAPVIQMSDPAQDSKFHPGETIHLEGIVTDNVGLSQLKVDIHSADGHDHKRNMSWEHEQTWPISGLSWQFHEDIEIPAAADTGDYHILVYALDAAGNQAQFVLIDFVIEEDHGGGSTDTEDPILNLTSPTHTNRQMITAGASISIQGMATDNDHLDEIHIALIDESDNSELAHIHLHHSDLDDHDAHTLNETITIPSVSTHTDAILEIEVKDEAGNEVKQTFLYHIDP